MRCFVIYFISVINCFHLVLFLSVVWYLFILKHRNKYTINFWQMILLIFRLSELVDRSCSIAPTDIFVHRVYDQRRIIYSQNYMVNVHNDGDTNVRRSVKFKKKIIKIRLINLGDGEDI